MQNMRRCIRHPAQHTWQHTWQYIWQHIWQHTWQHVRPHCGCNAEGPYSQCGQCQDCQRGGMRGPRRLHGHEKMIPLLRLLAKLGADLDDPELYARFEADGFMKLVAESVHDSRLPDGWKAVSVCHYGEQNGDLMRDPEVVFLILPDGITAYPVTYRNDYTGTNDTYYSVSNGRVVVNSRMVRDTKSFCSI